MTKQEIQEKAQEIAQTMSEYQIIYWLEHNKARLEQLQVPHYTSKDVVEKAKQDTQDAIVVFDLALGCKFWM